MRFLAKILLSALITASVSELGKRSGLLAAILASLPLTSILALTWLYLDTGDAERVQSLSFGIFWAVLPSLLFFVVFPLLLKRGMAFAPALGLACLVMAGTYTLYTWALNRLGIGV
jgi:drug/metabolite transporter (DMT)-like permease